MKNTLLLFQNDACPIENTRRDLITYTKMIEVLHNWIGKTPNLKLVNYSVFSYTDLDDFHLDMAPRSLKL